MMGELMTLIGNRAFLRQDDTKVTRGVPSNEPSEHGDGAEGVLGFRRGKARRRADLPVNRRIALRST